MQRNAIESKSQPKVHFIRAIQLDVMKRSRARAGVRRCALSGSIRLLLFVCLVFTAWFASGCDGGEALSQNARATDLKSIHDEQVEERTAILGEVTKAWNTVSAVKVGDPKQIDDAKATLDKLKQERDGKQEAAKEAVSAAQADLETAEKAAREFSGVAHFAGGSGWCGGDGCGGSCSDDCSYDKLCYDERCRCIPSCGDNECGTDGCGGICGQHLGACPGEQYCNEDYKCVDPTYRSETCDPSCSMNGTPRKAARQVKNSERSYSVSSYDREPNARTFSDYSTLTDYLATLTARANDLKTRQSAHAQRAAKIEALKIEATSKDQGLKEARSKLNDLVVASRNSAPVEGVFPGQADMDALKELVSTSVASHKTTLGSLRALESEHRSENNLMNGYGKAEKRARVEIQRLGAIANGWKAALAAVEAAQAAITVAQAAAQPVLDAIASEYVPRIAAAQAAIDDLKENAFGDTMAAVMLCAGPACPTGTSVLRPNSKLDLGRLASAVTDLHGSRSAGLRKHTEALKAQGQGQGSDAEAEAAPEGEEMEEHQESPSEDQLKEYPGWKTEVDNLETASIQLDELVGANLRTLGLRAALHAERESLGE